ncbi:MAG: CBS domain-containing protein [Patescibacteria group bacterium]|nr:CBS domain-containing protein [Patescibacteria group bacterium]
MSEEKTQNTLPFQNEYYLTDLMGTKVVAHGKRIGKLSDLLVIDVSTMPEVASICVSRLFGDPSLLIPWEKVKAITDKEIVVDVENVKKYEATPTDNDILLKDHVLDKKVLDIEDRDVEVVYDVKLVFKEGKLYIAGVDLSKYGLLRRIGLKRVANFIYAVADKIKNQTISWNYIQPLPTDLSSFKGELKLNVIKEKLKDIHPVDLADILEEMDYGQRNLIFEELDLKRASDTLEEIEPSVQRDLIGSMKTEKAAELLSLMTPGQAADVLSVLAHSQTNAILKLFKEEDVEKIKAIMEKQEEKILNLTTNRIIRCPPEMTIKQAQDEYQNLAKSKDVVTYIYVVNENDELVGIVDIKELLEGKEEETLKDIMTDTVISLNKKSTYKEASRIFSKYDFRSIPIVNGHNKLLGAVTYKDLMRLKHHFLE